ncbi:DUF1353 domain-containing protein [Dongshaea marina]|uniref:DUF1353 domain-containing protein n=1 Tax=Dongshaea marina TaxID=2047966 RepID=UPI000D3E9C37|nr:DUF1353 domain-containing protein [Dongshaea marina]
MQGIAYKKGYKYQLSRDYSLQIGLNPEQPINTRYITLSTEGELLIKAGYAWDGPSGPTLDTQNFMRGSLVHDALYQLMREQLLPPNCKEDADRLLQQQCLEDGMSRLRAWWVYRAVHYFGKSSTDPANKRPTLYAPESYQRQMTEEGNQSPETEAES